MQCKPSVTMISPFQIGFFYRSELPELVPRIKNQLKGEATFITLSEGAVQK